MRFLLILATLTTAVATAEPMRATLRADGVLLVDGEPMLPYGFYISTGHTGDRRLRCVELVHQAGGNIVHIEGPWDADTRFLDRAAELGVRVVAGHTETEAKLARVRTFADHPALVAWTIYDDANTKSTVPHLQKMNALIKAAAPRRLTFIPLGVQSRTVPTPDAAFFGCADIIGWENYPIACPNAIDATVRATETQMAAAHAAAQTHSRPVWVLPQTFAWPGGRVPTPTEYRNLCYTGLINGAKGIMSWCIYYKGDTPETIAQNDAAGKPSWRGWFLPDCPELWAECHAVGAELKQITPRILSGTYRKLTPLGADVTAATWTSPAGTLLIVANLTDQARPVELSLPPGTPELIPAFPTRTGALAVTAGRLTGLLPAAAVDVLQTAAQP